VKNVLDLGEGFYNLRGALTVRGVLPIGTHASLVRRKSGRFILLDAIDLDPEARRFVDEVTGKGDAIEAVLHLHPFHTLFVRSAHALYPRAKLYGTSRHARLAPELPWEALRTDEPALHQLFAEDLDFSVPRGVDFIPENENLHFSSVLAFHSASRTLHVDDTLNYVRLPLPFSLFKKDLLGLHPTLGRVLERRAGAARDFRAWARELAERVRSIDNVCAAHTSALVGHRDGGPSVAERVARAIEAVEPKLAAHERRFG
jgi:hypothetical protein